jgi:bis(5'-nucleosyl)-tetraphosphatase (symmetrical)
MRLLFSLRESVSVTLGNHDLHLLAASQNLFYGGGDSAEFDAVLTAPDFEELIGWLRQQPLACWSPEHRLLRVHAGVIPQWTWQDVISAGKEVSAVLQSDQSDKFLHHMYGNRPRLWREERTGMKRLRLITNILTRLRFCDYAGRGAYRHSGAPGSQPVGYKPWYKHKHRKTRDITIAFGHWAALGLRLKKRYLAMDSGCVWGGKLSALRLEDRALFQVKNEV